MLHKFTITATFCFLFLVNDIFSWYWGTGGLCETATPLVHLENKAAWQPVSQSLLIVLPKAKNGQWKAGLGGDPIWLILPNHFKEPMLICVNCTLPDCGCSILKWTVIALILAKWVWIDGWSLLLGLQVLMPLSSCSLHLPVYPNVVMPLKKTQRDTALCPHVFNWSLLLLTTRSTKERRNIGKCSCQNHVL